YPQTVVGATTLFAPVTASILHLNAPGPLKDAALTPHSLSVGGSNSTMPAAVAVLNPSDTHRMTSPACWRTSDGVWPSEIPLRMPRTRSVATAPYGAMTNNPVRVASLHP